MNVTAIATKRVEWVRLNTTATVLRWVLLEYSTNPFPSRFEGVIQEAMAECESRAQDVRRRIRIASRTGKV